MSERPVRFEVRLTKEEMEALTQAAHGKGISGSDLIRMLIHDNFMQDKKGK